MPPFRFAPSGWVESGSWGGVPGWQNLSCDRHWLPLSRAKKLETNTYRKQPSFTASRGPAGLRDAVNRRTKEEGNLQQIFVFSFLSRGNGIRWLPQEKLRRTTTPKSNPAWQQSKELQRWRWTCLAFNPSGHQRKARLNTGRKFMLGSAAARWVFSR